ncbi:MAG: extracellular solute-binding protein [Elusimicrobia bacterium]|nr:extracellular solute-binding protein [Candidatus Obscuribacterium magneticum]
MPNAGFATRGILQKYLDEFERRWPDVTIHLTIHPWSLAWNRLMEVVKGRYMGSLPDVIQVGTTWVATLAYLGALEKIPYEKVLPHDDKTSAYIWDPGAQSESGKELFCVPWFIDIRVLYYRRDIFDAIGVGPGLINDWVGFHQACVEVRKYLSRGGPVSRVVAPLAIPGQKVGVLMHDLAPFIWEAGGDFCSDDLQRGNLNSPATMRGCEFYFDLIHQGCMPIPSTDVPSGNFFTGNTAMQFSGTWPIETFLNPDYPFRSREVTDHFSVAMFPSGPQGRYTFLGGSNLAVAAVSPQKEMALELIHFLTEPSRQLDHARSTGTLTARVASMEKLFEKAPEAKKVFWDSLGHARRLPRLIPLGSVEQIITKMSRRILAFIRAGTYNHKKLYDEMIKANDDINTVLSLHRYGDSGSGVSS